MPKFQNYCELNINFPKKKFDFSELLYHFRPHFQVKPCCFFPGFISSHFWLYHLIILLYKTIRHQQIPHGLRWQQTAKQITSSPQKGMAVFTHPRLARRGHYLVPLSMKIGCQLHAMEKGDAQLRLCLMGVCTFHQTLELRGTRALHHHQSFGKQSHQTTVVDI